LIYRKKKGKQIIQISQIRQSVSHKEGKGAWQGGGGSGIEENETLMSASCVMIIYQDLILQEEWAETARKNIINMTDIS
jgi:hypothetical protein